MVDVVTIDGQTFRVGISRIARKASIDDGPNEGTAKDYTWIRDVVGTLYSYTIYFDVANGLSPADYDTLYYLLSAPVEFHTLTVPFGQSTISFSAGITELEDNVILMDGGNIWGDLSVTFKPRSPQRLPAEVTDVG